MLREQSLQMLQYTFDTAIPQKLPEQKTDLKKDWMQPDSWVRSNKTVQTRAGCKYI